MAMTIGNWQKELHREQVNLGKIISALRKKGDYRNAKKVQEVMERLKFLVFQPMPAGSGGRMPGVMDPVKFMEYMYPKLSRIMAKVGRNNFDLLMDTIGHADNPEKLSRMIAALGKHSTEVFSNLITTLSDAFRFAEEQGRLGGGGMTMEEKVSDAGIILEKNEVDCPCGSVTQINAKIVNTGNVKDSFSIEFSEGGMDSNLVIEAWTECGKATPELAPGESYPLVINIKPACSAFGVSQVGLSDRIRISVESVLEEVDKDSKFLMVNVK